VPTGLPRIIAFFHPILALIGLGLLAYVASLGLRARERGGARLRPIHERLAWWAYGLMAVNFALGVLSTWLLRPDLELAVDAHFRIGLAVLALLTVAAFLSRRIATDATARLLHPMLGLLAVVLSALQIFFGMPKLPL
jgi:hypothetical protein